MAVDTLTAHREEGLTHVKARHEIRATPRTSPSGIAPRPVYGYPEVRHGLTTEPSCVAEDPHRDAAGASE